MPTSTYCINPVLLKWARETIGLNLDQAATKLNVGVTELDLWEKGSSEPPIEKIRKFSEVYKRATTVFLMDSIPDENISPSFRQLLYSNISSFSSDTIIAIRKAIRIQNLAKEELVPTDNQFIKDLKSNISLSTEDLGEKIIDILDLSDEALTKNRNPFEQLNTWKAAIESKGIYILELGFPIEEAKGFAIFDVKAPIIVLNTNDYPRSRIFTLLHELGHFIFNGDAIDDEHTLLNFNSTDQLEVKCNYLAGACLVPSKYLIPKLSLLKLDPQNEIGVSLSTLSKIFNVSTQVVLRRLYSLHIIDLSQFSSVNKSIRDNFPQTLEGPEKPKGGNFYIKFMKNYSKAFIYDVLDAYRLNRISHFDVLDYLNIKSSTLSKLEARL